MIEFVIKNNKAMKMLDFMNKFGFYDALKNYQSLRDITIHGNKKEEEAEKYEGDWKNDVKEGKGVYYFSNGNRYVAVFAVVFAFIGDLRSDCGKTKRNRSPGSGCFSAGRG